MASISNEWYVNKGRTISHEGKYFRAGHRFPAADLNVDNASFGALVRDKSIVSGKERNTFVHPVAAEEVPPESQEPKPDVFSDDLAEHTKGELVMFAENLGINSAAKLSRMNKDELIAAIRDAQG